MRMHGFLFVTNSKNISFLRASFNISKRSLKKHVTDTVLSEKHPTVIFLYLIPFHQSLLSIESIHQMDFSMS